MVYCNITSNKFSIDYKSPRQNFAFIPFKQEVILISKIPLWPGNSHTRTYQGKPQLPAYHVICSQLFLKPLRIFLTFRDKAWTHLVCYLLWILNGSNLWRQCHQIVSPVNKSLCSHSWAVRVFTQKGWYPPYQPFFIRTEASSSLYKVLSLSPQACIVVCH